MKFLIWLGWLTLGAVITTSLRAVGIGLSGLQAFVLYALIFFGAYKSCKAYDRRGKTPEEIEEEKQEKRRAKEEEKQRERRMLAENMTYRAWFFGGILCFVALVVVAVVLMCLA